MSITNISKSRKYNKLRKFNNRNYISKKHRGGINQYVKYTGYILITFLDTFVDFLEVFSVTFLDLTTYFFFNIFMFFK